MPLRVVSCIISKPTMRSLFLIFLSSLAFGYDLPQVQRYKGGHRYGPNTTVPRDLQILGSINVEGFGPVKVVAPSWATNYIQMLENGFTLTGGGHCYLATGDDLSDPFVYWSVDLRNKHISYSIDVSNVGCKCNAALYWLKMPGHNEFQVPAPGPSGDYYCDANNGNENWCPEYDTFEGNAESCATTLHQCTAIPPHHYDHCDRYGCQTNACDGIPAKYCKGCDIDTTKMFSISHAQIFSGDKMVASNNFFQQDGKEASFDACSDPEYLESMSETMDGMVPVFSLWDVIDATWLDGCTGCQGPCDMAGTSVTFQDLKLQSVEQSPSKYVRDLYAKYN